MYQKLVQWPWCDCAWLASNLHWHELHTKSMGCCQEEDERHQPQQCRWPKSSDQSNLGFHYTYAVPQADTLTKGSQAFDMYNYVDTSHTHATMSPIEYGVESPKSLKYFTLCVLHLCFHVFLLPPCLLYDITYNLSIASIDCHDQNFQHHWGVLPSSSDMTMERNKREGQFL